MNQSRVQTDFDQPRESPQPPPRLEGVPELPKLATDVELVGELQGSGFAEQQWLIRRHGRFFQLTELLYRVAEFSNGERTLGAIAERVTEVTDWILTPEHVRQLILSGLIPIGLIDAVGETAAVQRPNEERSPLQVSLRAKTIGPAVIGPITSVLQVLYAPVVMIPLLIAVAVAHAWLYGVHGVVQAVNAILLAPILIPVAIAIVAISGVFHEFGHASALRYGGGQVREMGVGLYLFYPVLYTDMTDGYRLGRWARVRGDLGGFYFHLIFAFGLILLYLVTGLEFLLVPAIVINLDILYQCLVFVRFDGYWALADLTGIPDFFSQMVAFFRSLLPKAVSRSGRLPRLKPWVKAVFAAYIAVTIPVLALVIFPLLRGAPSIVTVAWSSLSFLAKDFAYSRAGGNLAGMVIALVQMLFLALPLVGMGYMMYSLGRKLVRAIWDWSRPTPLRRITGALAGAVLVSAVVLLWAPQVRLSSGGTPDPVGIESIEVSGRTHVEGPVLYEQNPPVGGNHAPIWQNCGFYASPIANENAVHSLEHGAVWITYRSDLPQADLEELRGFAPPRSHILVSPYPDQDAPIVASAWGKQLRLDSIDDPRLEQFIATYQGGAQAPERGGSCTGGVGQPDS